MFERIDFYKASPEAAKAMLNIENYINKCGINKSLHELIKIRASQINGCAYCVDLHSTDAIKAGESPRRIYALTVWKESPLFTEKEKAALAWTESITLISETHAPDAIYQEVFKYFTEKEIVDLTMAIITINSWNRLGIGFSKKTINEL